MSLTRSAPEHDLAQETPAEAPDQAPVVFGAPFIGDEEIAEVIDTLRSGWLGTGPKTQLFEERFAAYVGKNNAVATNSCTAALHLALNAIGIGPGDEVITTPLTFVATANAIEHCGGRPVFVDVRSRDGNVDPECIASSVTERTKAILPVHYCGAMADVPRIRALCPELPIIVDAAHAIEGRYANGARSAAGASITAYSFYVTKNLITGEGGMAVSDSSELSSLIRSRSLHGLDRDAWRRYAGGARTDYDMDFPGFKYNMTDVQAAIGLHQLKRIEASWQHRHRLWNWYNEAFQDVDGISTPTTRTTVGAGRHALHLYTLLIDWDFFKLDRAQLTERLHRHGISTGWHFRAVHLHRYYRSKYGLSVGVFPVAEHISHHSVSLPFSAVVDEASAQRVVDALLRSLRSE